MILGLLGAILLSLLIRLLGVEIGVWHKPICEWLVRVAAARLPADERAAAESEWLAVIGDLRSPTTQLLHSLSYAFSAFHIRQAIEPQAQTTSLFNTVMAIQAGTLGLTSTVTFTILYNYKEVVLAQLQQYVPTSKPVIAAIIATLSLLMIVMCFVNHLVWKRYFIRRARRRASTPIE